MAAIVIDDEQVRQVAAANSVVEVRDRHGNLVGRLTPEEENEVAVALRRKAAGGRKYTIDEVLEHLNGLDAK